jgi:hypothetical protein
MPGRKPAIVAFYEKVQKIPNGCWEWTGSKTQKGYGQLRLWRVTQMAHRCSYLFHIGPIPVGMMVCHKCDNPGCVRPDHLFLGTAKDNTSDMFNKKRQGRRFGCFTQKLSQNDIAIIKHQYDTARCISTTIGPRKAPGVVSEIASRFSVTSNRILQIAKQ